MSDELETLTDVLASLPEATPFFVPDEVLAVWFPPWLVKGSLDPESLRAAEERASRSGCKFGYDEHMQQWGFVKPATSN